MRLFVASIAVAAILCGFIMAACRMHSHTEPSGATDDNAVTDFGNPKQSVTTLLAAPDDLAARLIGSSAFPIPPHAKYLEGVRICLDPGHGGDAHKPGYKRGPTGVREAEINLRVARYLGDLLHHSGAIVKMTRQGDVDLSLAQRAGMANDWPADLFISCHHNAVSDNPGANRTTVWYHGDVNDRPANLDLARNLCRGLMDVLALPQITGLPLKSDALMYPNGFGVLRNAQTTAALCETSFYTHPKEEQRLRDPEYNFREAYGMFLGLAWYAYGGLPKATLVSPQDGVVSSRSQRTLEFDLHDGLGSRKAWGSDRPMILVDTISAAIDHVIVPHRFDRDTNRLSVELPKATGTGHHRIHIHFANMFKNSVLNPDFDITIK